MTKMWAGRTDADTNELADELNSSIGVDCRMYEQDINGSMAHAAMLGAQGIITQEEANAIIEQMCSCHGSMYAVIKKVIELREGLKLGSVRAPLAPVIEADGPKIESCAKMIDAAIDRWCK